MQIAAMMLSKQQAASSKQQAASSKQQAASSKQQAASSKQQAASSKQGKSALFWHFWKPRARAIQAGARGFLHIKTGLEGAFEQGRRNTK